MVRKKHLEEQLAKDYELLKEYENTLRTEIDPRLKLKWKENIKEVKQRIRECEEELGSLSASSVQPEPVTPYPSPPATSPSEPEQEVKPSIQTPLVENIPSQPQPRQVIILSSKVVRRSVLLGSTALGLVLIVLALESNYFLTFWEFFAVGNGVILIGSMSVWIREKRALASRVRLGALVGLAGVVLCVLGFWMIYWLSVVGGKANFYWVKAELVEFLDSGNMGLWLLSFIIYLTSIYIGRW